MSFLKRYLISSVSVFKSQKMWLGVRVMASPPLRRCCFQGTNLPWNGSVCTGWEPASITSGTRASSTLQYSVWPTPRRWPTTFCRRSTVGPVSAPVVLCQHLHLNTTNSHKVLIHAWNLSCGCSVCTCCSASQWNICGTAGGETLKQLLGFSSCSDSEAQTQMQKFPESTRLVLVIKYYVF